MYIYSSHQICTVTNVFIPVVNVFPLVNLAFSYAAFYVSLSKAEMYVNKCMVCAYLVMRVLLLWCCTGLILEASQTLAYHKNFNKK